ncbi:MAG: hypothetical protein JF887_10625 [Candidatus Dormibacteraeota bacterium]|uniref:Uncharacterized protein n=1 Tax=Candidatus Amunia macphersoniae TaxID=3127014 RepID=A0A934KPK7_9BACT|nr:hypothetical protein [Candidatus Dormibacteraeota bacterium]
MSGSPALPPPPLPPPGPPTTGLPPPPTWDQPPGGVSPPPRGGPGPRLFVIAAVVVVLLVAGTTGVLLAGRHNPAPRPSPAAVHTPSSAPTSSPSQSPLPSDTPGSGLGTTPFSDPDGYFTASYTTTPTKDARSITVQGRDIPYVQWGDQVDLTVAEIVAYANYPPEVATDTPNAVLQGSIQGIATAIKGTILTKSFGTFQGFTSADAIISVPPPAGSTSPGFLEARVILAGHTLFELAVTGLENPPTLFAALAASLTILKHSP